MSENKYASRKFILALIVSLNAIVALWFGKLPPEAFSTIQLGVLAIYMTGNVAQKFSVESKT